jgi:hypothetical protein
MNLSILGRRDINSSVLKGDTKYSDVSMTRQTPSNSSVFGAVGLSSLMVVVAATETCRFNCKFIHKKLVTSLLDSAFILDAVVSCKYMHRTQSPRYLNVNKNEGNGF